MITQIVFSFFSEKYRNSNDIRQEKRPNSFFLSNSSASVLFIISFNLFDFDLHPFFITIIYISTTYINESTIVKLVFFLKEQEEDDEKEIIVGNFLCSFCAKDETRIRMKKKKKKRRKSKWNDFNL